MEETDLVTILGNLLDNALEAVAKAEEKTIRLEMKYDIGSLHIALENSFNGEVKQSKKGGNNRLESLKGGKDHGYGLKNIISAAEKYDGTVTIDYDEKMFCVDVMIYVGMRKSA